jgi:vesicle coat complex subunit
MADQTETDATDRKNELSRLRDLLTNANLETRKAACKRVIALMRSGENVQLFFSPVLQCVNTSDLELKKLAYLYLITYSSHEPEQAIMAVNTFVRDSQDPNPLVRALAVRNMCRIRIESVAEHMVIPLKKCLHDPDPYVRKTVAFGVSKLYDIIPEAVENSQLFSELVLLLQDENPMVVANTTASILEVNDRRTAPIFQLSSATLAPFLNAVTSSTDWCQGILLETLSKYRPESADDASFLIERMVPLLRNSNPAVVVGAFRSIFMFLEPSQRDGAEVFPQILPPFLTLVSASDVEVQYVVLRSLSLFVQKYPRALTKEIRLFFCKYNEPSYLKMEKLDIIITLCCLANALLVLNELNEYCNAVDVAFVRKSIRCIGQIALKMEVAGPKCVDILVRLLGGKADYACEEAIIVFCDVLRKYPGKFESVLASACAHLENIREPRAKAAGIWILGEYSRIIDGVDGLLDPYLDSFHDEPALVQLQILSTLVKVYLEKPDATRDQLQFVFSEATKDGNIPDVKNRALTYWRLLSADPKFAREVVCFDKQLVEHSGVRFEPEVLEELIKNIGSVAGVLHIVPGDFVSRHTRRRIDTDDADDDTVVRNWSPVKLNDSTILDLFIDFDRGGIYLKIVNKSPQPVGQLAFAIQKNPIGLAIKKAPEFPETIEGGDIVEVAIAADVEVPQIANLTTTELQLALRAGCRDVYGLARIPLEIATIAEGKISQDEFRANFQAFQAVMQINVHDREIAGDEQLAERFVFVVGRHAEKAYVSFAFAGGAKHLAELAPAGTGFTVIVRGSTPAYLQLISKCAVSLFGKK